MAYNVIHYLLTSRKVQPVGSFGTQPRLTASLVFLRCIAFLIDAAIFFVFSGVLFDPSTWSSMLELVAHISAMFTLHPWIFHPEHIPMLTEIVYRIVGMYAHIFFAVYIFLTVLEAYKGQTPGKFIVGLRVVKTDGRKLDLIESGIRNAGKVFLLPLDLIIGILFYAKRGYLRFFDFYTDVTVERVLSLKR